MNKPLKNEKKKKTVAWSATAANHTGTRRPRVRAAAACARPERTATTRSPNHPHRSPPVTSASASAHAHASMPRINNNNNHPLPSPHFFSSPPSLVRRVLLLRSRNRVLLLPLGTIGGSIAHPRTSDRPTTAAFGGLRALFGATGGSVRGSGGVWLTASQRRRRSSWIGSR